ncbi:MAG: hypothetical protein UV38_C0001G0190 [candidate division TM6 bacterium GW2011_GWE2_42_60]|nr:MAG: hypothetical protein UV38_C0001G0190 [candidate division TM6 bacterium GW2011_GWE2_42_60]HBY05615.1 hypothetical protein [Candidatus Dependentiae bacterium]
MPMWTFIFISLIVTSFLWGLGRAERAWARNEPEIDILRFPSKRVAIAFDIHGVLFSFDGGAAATVTLSYGTLVALAQKFFGFKGFLISSAPVLIPLCYGLGKYGYYALYYGVIPTVEYHIFGGNFFLFRALRWAWVLLSRFYSPCSDVFEYAWSLKKRGYVLFIESDIGPWAYEDLKERYHEFFVRDGVELFDAVFSPGGDFLCEAVESDDHEQVKWVNKSDERYLDLFKIATKSRWPDLEKVILVDNNARNLRCSLRSTFSGFYIPLLFSKIDKLEDDFKELGVF